MSEEGAILDDVNVNVRYRRSVIRRIRDIRAGSNGKRCLGSVDDIQVGDLRMQTSD